MCCLEATVCFSSAIDGQSVSAVITRGLCDVCNNINTVTFVTDEQNVHSLCPAEGPANLVAVRIPRLSVCHRQPHMYLRSSVPSDVYSDMYVKDVVCPVSLNTVGTMVEVCQVMISHTIICRIQSSRLTTLVRNESRCSCSCTEILAFLTMKMELPSPLLSDSPFLSSEQFFCFSSFSNVRRNLNAKSRPTRRKTKIETPLLLHDLFNVFAFGLYGF